MLFYHFMTVMSVLVIMMLVYHSFSTNEVSDMLQHNLIKKICNFCCHIDAFQASNSYRYITFATVMGSIMSIL